MLLWQNEFLNGMRKFGVDMRLAKKGESGLMRFLEKVLFFCPDFSKFVTSVRNVVYAPSLDELGMETLAHESQHVWDWNRWKLWYTFIYTFPQNLAILSLLSFWSLWWLGCLVFLAPMPAIGRAWVERRGYLVTLLVLRWKRGEVKAKDMLMAWRLERKEILWAVSQFVGPSYYFMWPFQRSLEKWFDNEIAKNLEPKDLRMMWIKEFVEKRKGMTW